MLVEAAANAFCPCIGYQHHLLLLGAADNSSKPCLSFSNMSEASQKPLVCPESALEGSSSLCPGKLRHIRTAVSEGSAPAPVLPAALSCAGRLPALGGKRGRGCCGDSGWALGCASQPLPIALLSPRSALGECSSASQSRTLRVLQCRWLGNKKCEACALSIQNAVFSSCSAPQGCCSVPWSSPVLARVGCSAPPMGCRKVTQQRHLESGLCSAHGIGGSRGSPAGLGGAAAPAPSGPGQEGPPSSPSSCPTARGCCSANGPCVLGFPL